MVCQTRELEQILKNMTWTCLLQLLSQGNSALAKARFCAVFISYFIGLKHWAKAIVRTPARARFCAVLPYQM